MKLTLDTEDIAAAIELWLKTGGYEPIDDNINLVYDPDTGELSATVDVRLVMKEPVPTKKRKISKKTVTQDTTSERVEEVAKQYFAPPPRQSTLRNPTLADDVPLLILPGTPPSDVAEAKRLAKMEVRRDRVSVGSSFLDYTRQHGIEEEITGVQTKVIL